MNSFQIVAILVSLAAVFAFINHRFLHLHPTVGIMLQSLAASMAWLALQHVWPAARTISSAFQVNLSEALFHWMLGGLLFAGAMQLDLAELHHQRIAVAVLAIVGTVLSTFIVAELAYLLCGLAGINASFGICAVFGAVISPTDPVAVMGFLKTVQAPREIQAIIGGESLFNDGVGVVLFTVLAQAGHGISWSHIPVAFFAEMLGGAGIGLVVGLIVFVLLRKTDNYQVEVLLTLALALGGYTLADAMGVSGPIAAVVAGLIIGNRSSVRGTTRQHLHDFWELVDETLNSVLFLLVGLVILQMQWNRQELAIALVAIGVVLLARWISVWCSVSVVALYHQQPLSLRSHMVGLLTWGGLRGGLALAMALSLPLQPGRDRLISAVFGVVVFSILIQGSTLPRVFSYWLPAANDSTDDPNSQQVPTN